MCLNGKVYLSGRRSYSSNQQTLIYTPATDAWDTLDTPVYDFALTTYRSKLVLVGGREYIGENVEGSPSNKVWTLSEDGKWEDTLPPMETSCHLASAVSHGDHLLVVDGEHNIVHVYNGHHWAKAQHLSEEMKRERPPFNTQQSSVNSVVFNSELYVLVRARPKKIYSASLDSLIASSQSSETSQPSTVWKELPYVRDELYNLAVFREKLVAVGRNEFGYIAIYGYSPSGRSWDYVGATPLSSGCSFSFVVLSSNELIVIEERGAMFTGTLNGG